MHGSTHRSRRCSTCNVHWPLDQDAYQPCPECGGNTWGSTQEPILNAEALSRKRHALFEVFYERREEARRKAAVEHLERDLGTITEAA